MAIALRATNGATASVSGTLAVPVPTGTISGDVLLIGIIVSGTTVPSTPSGLTLVTSANAGPAVGIYRRVCDGTEGASYSFTIASGAAATSRSYSGVDNTTPVNTNGTPNRTASSATCTASSITPTVNNCELIWFGFTATNGGATAPAPSGFANSQYQHQASGTTTSAATDDEAQGTAAATGSVAGTFGAAANNYGALVALQPASGATANTLTASPGSMAITGDAATPPVKHSPTVSSASYAITGDATTQPVAHKPTLGSTSFTIIGNASPLPTGHHPSLGAGAFVITGDAISPRVQLHLAALLGTFAISGTSATPTAATARIPVVPTPSGADRYGFDPFPGRYLGADCYPGPLVAWRPYFSNVEIVYNYAARVFVGTRDKTLLNLLGANNIGDRN